MNGLLGTAGMLAAITSIIVEVLKNILPKKFPTKILTVIVAILITVGFVLFGTIGQGLTVGAMIMTIIMSIFGGGVVAFISMFGFDSCKEIIERYSNKNENE